MDIASLGLRVDSGEVDKGARSLDRLTAAAGKAERAAEGVAAGSRSAGAATNSVASAADAAAASLQREGDAATRAGSALKAANQNTLRMGGSMSGLAAQFQDIGVTAAAGMNPMIIGLQQGTQIAGQMEMALANGGSAASVFGTAIKSLISPVSLLSIGLTVLLAAGLQMVDWAGVAQAALYGLAGVIETIAPYAVAAAAGLALLYAPALIGGVTQLIALMGRLAVQAALTAAAMAAANPAVAFVAGVAVAVAAANIFRDELTRILGFDIVDAAKKGVNWIIGAFVGGYNGIKTTWSMLPAAMGDFAISAVNNVIAATEMMLNSAATGINNFLSKFLPTITYLRGEKAGTTEFAGGLPMLPNDLSLGSVVNPFAGAGAQAASSFSKSFSDAQGFDYVGKGIELVKGAASGAADALRGMAAGLSGAGAAGEAAAGGLKKTSSAADKVKDSINSAKGVVKGFLSDLRQGLMNGEGFWKSFGNAALNVLNKIIDKVEGQLVDALFSLGSGAGGGGNIFSTVLGWLGFAKGGVFDRAGQVHAFARGGVVSQPTVFPFARGVGLMGEAGPEAIMPLRRGPDGRLGVSAANQNSVSRVHVTVGVDVDDSGNILPFVKSVSQSTAGQVTTAAIGEYDKGMPGRINDVLERHG